MTSAIEVFNEIAIAGESLPSKVADLLCQTTRCSDYLHTPSIALQQHPLGFFCIRWNLDEARSLRIHVWDRRFDWTQTPNWPIHDHVFAFRSAVLRGAIQNKTYDLIQNTSKRRWEIYDVNYINQCSVLTPRAFTNALRVSGSTLQPAGSTYELPAGILHRSTLRTKSGISALATTTNLTAPVKPRVIGALGSTGHSFDRLKADARVTAKIITQAISLLRESSARES